LIFDSFGLNGGANYHFGVEKKGYMESKESLAVSQVMAGNSRSRER
jgi:hypothetical protein